MAKLYLWISAVALIAAVAATASEPPLPPEIAARRAVSEKLMLINQARPHRRDGPLRYENISDEEVREVQSAAAEVLPQAIVNISGVTTGCPCEDGEQCSDQVWIVAYRPDRSVGLMLSKISHHWVIGVVQRW